MERRTQTKKRYQSASYLNSGAVFYGTLLFTVARIFTLLQLFTDAASRKKLDQAPPENFTFLGITWLLVVIGIIAGLLWQYVGTWSAFVYGGSMGLMATVLLMLGMRIWPNVAAPACSLGDAPSSAE